MAACSSKRKVLNEEEVSVAKLKKIQKDCSVIELKRWLQCHGLQKKGNKTELVERVNLSMGNIKVDPKVDSGKWYELKRSGSCISQPDIIQDIPNSGWSLFPSKNIPTMFNYGHV